MEPKFNRFWTICGGSIVLVLAAAFISVGDEKANDKVGQVVVSKDTPLVGSKVDELAAKLVEVRKKRLELEAEESRLREELSVALKKWSEWLKSLGLDLPYNPPEPVVPVSPFFKALSDAWNSERDTNKKEKAKILAAIYRLAARESQNQDWETCSELAELISLAVEKAQGLGSDSLVMVRAVVRQELSRVAPNLDSRLTPEIRSSVERVYREAAEALEKFSA